MCPLLLVGLICTLPEVAVVVQSQYCPLQTALPLYILEQAEIGKAQTNAVLLEIASPHHNPTYPNLTSSTLPKLKDLFKPKNCQSEQ